MWAFLLTPLKSLGQWILGFVIGWLVDYVKMLLLKQKEKKEQAAQRKEIKSEIEELDKRAAVASKEELDELRKKKIELEERYFNQRP